MAYTLFDFQSGSIAPSDMDFIQFKGLRIGTLLATSLKIDL
jgi:hypothetical protein